MTPSIVTRLRAEVYAARRDRDLTGAANLLRDAVALEPGGPSAVFGRLGVTPVYSRLAALDTLDYSDRTLWSDSGEVWIEPRQRLIGEAGRLEKIPDDSYDALLASHVLEHLADPLRALAEWQRVVRSDGHLLLVLPHRDGTFDHRRAPTSLDHMREDAARETGEDDLTHLEEVLALHDLARDPGAPDPMAFERRCRENPATRAMHHHVFVSQTAADMCEAAGLHLLLLRPMLPCNILCLCQVGEDHGDGLSPPELSGILRRSPFASDHAQLG